jgi:hypothetical protein
METTFSDAVEIMKGLSPDEKEELKTLLERFIIEERRRGIRDNARKSVRELRDGKIDFSQSVAELKERLHND